MAYNLNVTAGAYPCGLAHNASVEAQALLVEEGFIGTGQYLRAKDSNYSYALELAEILDQYNNNFGLNDDDDPEYIQNKYDAEDFKQYPALPLMQTKSSRTALITGAARHPSEPSRC